MGLGPHLGNQDLNPGWRLAMCKASDLPAVLLLNPCPISQKAPHVYSSSIPLSCLLFLP